MVTSPGRPGTGKLSCSAPGRGHSNTDTGLLFPKLCALCCGSTGDIASLNGISLLACSSALLWLLGQPERYKMAKPPITFLSREFNTL